MPNIHKMIVHDLNLAGNNPKYSENLINLKELDKENEDALEFFKQHIKKNRTQSNTKECKFNLEHANLIKTTVTELVEEEEKHEDETDFDDYFISKSKIIAESLSDSMKGKSRSDGAVFVLLYTFQEQKYLGVLKMDPNLGIQVEEDFSLKVRNDMLPTPNEILHKTAFIKYNESFSDDDIHLFVLDRQQSDNEPARYFMHDFLNAEETANSNNLTEILEREIKKNIIHNIESFGDRSVFNERLKAKLSSDEEFNLDEDLPVLSRGLITDGFPINESLESIKNAVLSKYPDSTFSFVPAPTKVKDKEYRSADRNVIIKIKNELDEDLYDTYIDQETGETVFKFSPQLNIDVWG